MLGGKDYCPLDDVIAEQLARNKIAPAIAESRRFARRAVSHLLNHHQITQFAELGCGFPHAPNVHDIAEDHTRSARTLYIGNDQLAANHARTAEVDLTDTAAVVEAIATTFDMSTPIALILSGTAELIDDGPSMIAALTHALPARTWLVLTHITADVIGHDITSAALVLRGAGIAYHPRTHDDVASILTGYDVHTPALVVPHRWRPESIGSDRYGHATEPLHPEAWDLSAYAAIGQWRPR
ncbi:S-adenosyl methyltransferase [Nocardia farcinica]|uniref:S-adenosyl methyltransferase n=1 Tax=Nocardia farcinica TaxID=37329 RepID=A0A449GBZ4_NOCFR|nr:S-adenosyl methyltransferase [Nocardia farcinica]